LTGSQLANVILFELALTHIIWESLLMDRDVFILSAVSDIKPAEAIRHALENIEIPPSRVQDAVFGYDASFSLPDVQQVTQEAGLTCLAVNVSSSLRAVFFGAQSILSGDLELALVIGLGEDGSTALLLGSPDAVGRFNLLPRARLAARSLSGTDSALRAAGLASGDLTVIKNGERGARLVKELLEELEQLQAQWGLVSIGQSALLVERI
jgi:hypothetical protein